MCIYIYINATYFYLPTFNRLGEGGVKTNSKLPELKHDVCMYVKLSRWRCSTIMDSYSEYRRACIVISVENG